MPATFAVALFVFCTPAALPAQSSPGPTLTARQAMANADRLTRQRTSADCRREAAAAMARGDQDIIVCAAPDDQHLPVPEVYGPVAGSTDGAAVDPRGEPCGLRVSNPCYEGFNVLAAVPALVGVVRNLLNPDRDLGPPTPIPDRFRGANR